ncbi:MAG: DNA topoisomerase IB [Ilumatobacteraceae bacterium]
MTAWNGGPSLRFGSDAEPGIRRRGRTRFSYHNERTGRPASKRDRERISALAVPPAWTDVWIAADPTSHVQATGRDARGRKQYRYHPDFMESRSDHKFADLVPFGTALGRLRRRVDRDIRSGGLDHDRVVAVVVRLLDVTGLRVGNAEYARDNHSFGLTTLRDRHAVVRGSTISLAFRGKSKHAFDVSVDSVRLAGIVRRCQNLPGQHLFQYRAADGEVGTVCSSDVNGYLAEHGSASMSAKTFRTWNASVLAAEGLVQAASDGGEPTAVVVNDVIDHVADELGNTRSVCRASYVHPAIVDAFLDETLLARWRRPVGQKPTGITVVERRVLRLLKGVQQPG